MIKCDAWGTVIKADISSFGLHLFALELNISTNMDLSKEMQLTIICHCMSEQGQKISAFDINSTGNHIKKGTVSDDQ